MRLLLSHPEDYCWRKKPFDDRCQYAWAIAGTIAAVGIGTAVAGGIASSNAAKSAAKGQEALANQQRELAAQQTTENRQREMEGYLPGALEQRQQISGIIGEQLRGEIPQDVREQTMRVLAELTGASFNPFTAGKTGGFQMPEGQLARQLGLTSMDIQNQGISMAADWQAQAANFTNQVASDRLAGYQQAFNTQGEAIKSRYAADMANVGMIQGVGSSITGAAMMGFNAQQAQANRNAYGYGNLRPLSAGYRSSIYG